MHPDKRKKKDANGFKDFSALSHRQWTPEYQPPMYAKSWHQLSLDAQAVSELPKFSMTVDSGRSEAKSPLAAWIAQKKVAISGLKHAPRFKTLRQAEINDFPPGSQDAILEFLRISQVEAAIQQEEHGYKITLRSLKMGERKSGLRPNQIRRQIEWTVDPQWRLRKFSIAEEDLAGNDLAIRLLQSGVKDHALADRETVLPVKDIKILYHLSEDKKEFVVLTDGPSDEYVPLSSFGEDFDTTSETVVALPAWVVQTSIEEAGEIRRATCNCYFALPEYSPANFDTNRPVFKERCGEEVVIPADETTGVYGWPGEMTPLQTN